MSLRKAKALFCTAVILISLVLANDGVAGWLMAVLLLVSALPGWRLITRAAATNALSGALTLLEDAPHTPEADQSSEDQPINHLSVR